MIDSIRIIDAKYSGLEKKFPKGSILDTSFPIVLLVSPNGSGKTALFIWSKPLYVILIENKNVTESNLKTFNFLWQTAK